MTQGRALRVLFVDHARGLGGAEHSLLELLAALPEGVSPTVATRSGALAGAARELRIPVRLARLERLRTPTFGLRLARGVRDLDRICAEFDPDVVHANVYRAAMYVALARSARGRMVWHVRDIHRNGLGPRWLCARSSAVVANSRASREALPCAARARVIANPIAQSAPRARSRTELGFPGGGPIVANVGRLRPWKGQADFLDAAARVRSPAVFAVIGGRVFADAEAPQYGQELVERARALGISERVVFAGQRDDLADIWPHIALLVHTARAEPFGRVVAEAQRAGVPVVAYADGGVPEIVLDGETGLLVPAGETAAVARAVDGLLQDRARREEMGAAARRSAERFSPERHVTAMIEVYRMVANRRSDND